jgi:hypothetical protein
MLLLFVALPTALLGAHAYSRQFGAVPAELDKRLIHFAVAGKP